MSTEVKISNGIVIARDAVIDLTNVFDNKQLCDLLTVLAVCDCHCDDGHDNLWMTIYKKIDSDAVITGEELMWLGWVFEAYYDLDSELWGELYKELVKIGGAK